MADKVHYHVFFLNVGQGNSSLIVKREITENGSKVQCSTLLIDSRKGGESEVNPVELVKECFPKEKINDKDITVLNAMVITHPHDDHIGGLHNFLNDTDILVKKIFHPDYDFLSDRDTDDYRAYNKLRKDSSAQTETRVIAGRNYGNDTGIPFYAMSPPSSIENSDAFKELSEKIQVHNQSVVLSLSLNNVKLLVLGDANQECIKRVVKNYEADIDSNILLASHHGSNSIFVPEAELEETMADIERGGEKSGWDESFLEKISPDYTIISCGKSNKYKHPHAAALEAYSDASTVKRTDEASTIHVFIDENGTCTIYELHDYESLKTTIKNLFPSNVDENKEIKNFFIGSSALPVAPRNA